MRQAFECGVGNSHSREECETVDYNICQEELLNVELRIPTVEKNVRQRMSVFIKNNLFRKVKFITSQAAFTSAFRKVLLVETPKNPFVFQLTYENVSPRH